MNMGILLILTAFVNVLLNHLLLERRKGWIFCILIFLSNALLGYALSYMINYFLKDSSYLKFSLYIVGFTYLIYLQIIFKESFAIKLFTMLSTWLFSSMALYISTLIVNSFLKNSTNNLDVIYSIRILFELLFIPILYLFVRKKYQEILKSISSKTIYLMALYPLLGQFVLLNIFDLSILGHLDFKMILESCSVILFTICGYILVFLGIDSFKKNVELKYNIEFLMNQVELQQENYKLINESVQKKRSLEHDMRHHISLIKSMICEKRTNEAISYIEKYNNHIIETDLPTICSNFTIDSLLKYYMSYCTANSIDFKIKINISEELKIDALDLCVVLGNCIQNAIEACEKVTTEEEKFIVLVSQTYGENIVFKIKNSFNGKIVKEDNCIKSSKGERLGIGLSNVKQVVSKYKGRLDLKYKERIFEVCIVL